MRRSNNDKDLFSSFKQGEAGAIRDLYDLHYKPLCFFAYRITGNKEESEDLVTESFLKMLHKREEFENLSNIKSFLYLVTRNACINSIKAEKRHNLAHAQMQFLLPDGETNEDLLREEMVRIELLRQIYEEIEELPARCREIFKLLFIEGLGTDEIGRRLGLSPQTVRSQKARALQLLKSQLLKKGLLPALILLLYTLPNENFSA